MLEQIIFISIISYFIWKRTEKIKAEYLPVHPNRLFYLPIVQCLLCACFCTFSLSFDGNLPKDEINQFVEQYEIVGDLSSALLGLDLTTDQVTMYMLTKNLHSKATYILIGSIIMMLAQTICAYRKQLDKLIIEGVAAVHTLCIFYIGNLLGEIFDFWINQMGTIKLLNAISGNSEAPSWGLIALFIIPFHYLYHYVLEKYYANQQNEVNINK